MRETQPNAFARNSDLIGVGALLLSFTAPTMLALSLTDYPRSPLSLPAFAIFITGFALAFAVVVVDQRGRGAGATALVLSIVCSPVFVGLALITIAAE